MSGVGKNPNIPVGRLPQLLLLLWMTEESLDRVRLQGFPQNWALGLFGPGVLSSPTRSYLREEAKKSCAG